MLTKEQQAVLALMEVLVARDEIYKSINAQLKSFCQDFSPRVNLMDDNLWGPIMNLMDIAAGDSIPSYFMEEARNMKDGGATTEADGSVWPCRSLDDVRAYLEHINTTRT